MENKRKGEAMDSITGAMQAAAEAAAALRKRSGKRGEKKAYRFITMRVEKTRYEELQELFGSKGLAMATAANMALEYIAEMVQSGAMTLSRGGIIDLRRR
jgi:hypothetical protein